jgi:ABC-2 type transport system ATP-binding protein
MIVIDSVTKHYGRSRRRRRPALDGVSLEMRRGAVHAVVGPNGAGKSTLFSLVLGFIHTSAGEISIDGDDPRHYVRDHGAGYLPERFSLPPAWRVREALHGFAERERLGSRAAAKAAADGAIERLGLGAHADKRAGALSRGLLQRVGLAQALLAPRELLVLDEPTEGLDPEWRLRLRNELGRLRAEGRTVLLASHDLVEVERVADHVIVLDDGQVRQSFITQADTTTLTYTIRVATATPHVAELFPGAEALQADRGDAGAAGPAAYRIEVSDIGELTARVAVLLAGGAQLVALEPTPEPLESRVRRALDEGAG